ncbi:YbaB/EbfC family nucleoid-associated protein [Nonomuraea angiospora]|uniref:YbaB/EbfC family nucleoid-associated protein n=1 Tax=Nonomuraea angiospora TaxID=46172 RepID=UPI0029B8D38B|nr:YbaB/EbfC family nucleoid-associated protein [Nonomuraea angiospora]MDX3106095.1 YbaB/EbfC family nucleoid-associated protein [Nonomuraea angiospora]
MDEPWRLLEQLVQEVNQQTEQLKKMQEKARELSATAKSKDGMVTVTVGPRGEVRTIEFDPRVYRKLSPSELAASVVEQIGRATRQVSTEMKELMEPFGMPDLPFEDLFGEGTNFESFLPRPGTPEPR